MRAGSIKAYAVTSERRLAAAPEIPTVSELGLPRLSYAPFWFGLFAPKPGSFARAARGRYQEMVAAY